MKVSVRTRWLNEIFNSRYYSSWIEAEEVNQEDQKSFETGSEEISNKPRKRTQSKNLTKDEDTEENLLKYNAFEAPDIGSDIREEDISWCEDEIKRESDLEIQSSDSDSSDGSDVRPLDNRSKHSGVLLKKSERRDSSEGVMFTMDDSMFQFGDMLDSDVSVVTIFCWLFCAHFSVSLDN